MKKTITIILALCAMFSFVACGGRGEAIVATEAAQHMAAAQDHVTQSETRAYNSRPTHDRSGDARQNAWPFRTQQRWGLVVDFREQQGGR